MLTSAIVGIVSVSQRLAWLVVLVAIALTGACGYYAAQNFAINTDSSQLISPNLPWRQREIAFEKAFPRRGDLIVVVIDGATPEVAEDAASRLAFVLGREPTQFKLVHRPDGGEFFDRNGLLFLSEDEVEQVTLSLLRAQPLLGSLAADPTLRGLAHTLGFIAQGVAAGEVQLEQFQHALDKLAAGLADASAGRPAHISWSELMSGKAPNARELRRFINVKPVLDFTALEPGARASLRLREMAAQLNLDAAHGVQVRLTGTVPMADEEFGTIAEGMEINTALTVLSVLILVWLALRSGKLILAVFASLVVGLVATAAAGLAMVGALNLISIAFAVLFVGIGVDFGIQFCVRYRAERHLQPDLGLAIRSAAREAGMPLALAAAATAAGFLAFLPTDYRGVSELGLIAGTGMVIAFFISITVLPALLMLLNPAGESKEVGYKWLAPIDRFLARHRYFILTITGLAVVAGLPLLGHVSFDFNPLNLRSHKVESVATYLDLLKDQTTTPNTVDILASSMSEARQITARLSALPEVAAVVSLDSFVPPEQEKKLAAIAEAAGLLGPTLNPVQQAPAATDAQTVEALKEAAEAFAALNAGDTGARKSAQAMADTLKALAEGTAERRRAAEVAVLPAFKANLERIKLSLTAKPVKLEGLPNDLVQDWTTSDGRPRLEVFPKGDSNDNEVLRQFARAVLAVEPSAIGTPVLIQESANTVVTAFLEAGVLAFVSITLILLLVLRRVSDMFYTLLPLVLAGIVTLEVCVLFGLRLNFANIIALPLLLGVGVAFKIYYVLAWRAGEGSLLASSLTRAVFFSALTTATAFGSLWMSSHPGTSSMGKLLSLSLLTTLIAAVVFQPILMGPPRTERDEAEEAKS